MYKREELTGIYWVQCERTRNCARARSHGGECLPTGPARARRLIEQRQAEKIGRDRRPNGY